MKWFVWSHKQASVKPWYFTASQQLPEHRWIWSILIPASLFTPRAFPLNDSAPQWNTSTPPTEMVWARSQRHTLSLGRRRAWSMYRQSPRWEQVGGGGGTVPGHSRKWYASLASSFAYLLPYFIISLEILLALNEKRKNPIDTKKIVIIQTKIQIEELASLSIH